MKVAIVTTTINIPKFLSSYVNNCNKKDEFMFFIIGDKKSPDLKIMKYINKLKSDSIVFDYWPIGRQKDIYDTDKLQSIIPYNSIRRRNLGYLEALVWGADITITVDDDNFANRNWANEHIAAFTSKHNYSVSSQNFIVNPCRILDINKSVYSRGYPLPKQFSDTFDVGKTNKKVVLNMGLWNRSPDVDALINFYYNNLNSKGINKNYKKRYAIAQNNYFPVNTQNTAFQTKLTPAFYALLMDSTVDEFKVDRYDDVWAGYIFLKLIHKMGDTATFGVPLTDHIRNKHNYLSDLKSESLCMFLNTKVWEIINNYEIESKNYIDGYLEIADLFNVFTITLENKSLINYFHKLAKAMNEWVNISERLL